VGQRSQEDIQVAVHILVADTPAEELRFQDSHRKEQVKVGTADNRVHIRWVEEHSRVGQ
jgi:hypothetical protein